MHKEVLLLYSSLAVALSLRASQRDSSIQEPQPTMSGHIVLELCSTAWVYSWGPSLTSDVLLLWITREAELQALDLISYAFVDLRHLDCRQT